MKRSGVISTAILFLVLGTASLALAQQEQQGKGQGKSPQGQQHQQKQATPQTRPQATPQTRPQATPQTRPQPAPQQHPQATPQARPQPAQQPRQQASRPVQRQGQPAQRYGGVYHGGVQPNGPTFGGVHESGVPQRQAQVHSGFIQSRARSWNDDHRTWGQRGGYTGYRVPQERFSLYFGRSHSFRMYGLPMSFVGGYPRFQYDGYWVTFVDPWPESWSDNWYDTDDVYLDYTDDGYYVYNRAHPGMGIAVTISF